MRGRRLEEERREEAGVAEVDAEGVEVKGLAAELLFLWLRVRAREGGAGVFSLQAGGPQVPRLEVRSAVAHTQGA